MMDVAGKHRQGKPTARDNQQNKIKMSVVIAEDVPIYKVTAVF